MSVLQIAARVRDASNDTEPELVTKTTLAQLHLSASEPTQSTIAAVAHFGYGVACGMVFALIEPVVPRRVHRVAMGAGFGVLVGVASYETWVPAWGALPALHRQRPRRRWPLMVAHLVFGVVLGAVVSRRPDG
jgi:uncharacterized membrane protein YagU involved in acid resistance